MVFPTDKKHTLHYPGGLVLAQECCLHAGNSFCTAFLHVLLEDWNWKWEV